ncbi:MAG: transposase [bacterium]
MQNSEFPKRKSIRLKDYDYSFPGNYFITICAEGKKNYFGRIAGGEMKLSKIGEMIEKWLKEIENKFKNVGLGKYSIMPNHIHFIIITDNPFNAGGHAGPPLQNSLSDIIQWFKTMTTNEYIRNIKLNKLIPFDKRFWQRNFYEHIIRNQKSYENISQYILNNPSDWENDVENEDVFKMTSEKERNDYYNKIII